MLLAIILFFLFPLRAEAHKSTMSIQMRELRYEEAEKEIMGISIPSEIKQACEDAGAEYNICPEFLEALIFYESGYNENARNGHCIGLCQVNEIYHGNRIGGDLYDIETNIYTAADYLSELFEEEEDCGRVLTIYNGQHKDYSKYADNILTLSERLERAHDK